MMEEVKTNPPQYTHLSALLKSYYFITTTATTAATTANNGFFVLKLQVCS